MGTTGAIGMAEAVSDGDVGLEQALSWHLQSNHFPPVPASMIPVCVEAIGNADREEWDKPVDLPDGTSYLGNTAAPTHAIVEAHHLDAFLQYDDEERE